MDKAEYKKCESCGRVETQTDRNVNRKTVLRDHGHVRELCGSCHRKEKPAQRNEDCLGIIRRVIDKESYSEYTWAYEELLNIQSKKDKETSALMRKIRKVQEEKSAAGIFLDKLVALSDKNPTLRYEFARKEANKLIANKQLRKMIFKRDGNCCKYCGSKENLSIDHIKPVLVGGSNDISNLQTLCKSCNSRKGATFSPQETNEREKL